MSLPGHLCLLLTIVGLILPTRGQTLEEATSIFQADATPVNTHVLTPSVHLEPQASSRTPSPQAGEASPAPPETQTQQPTSMDVHLTPGPSTDKSSTEGSHHTDFTTDPDFKPTGSSEDNPFFYDEATLRKRGLLVAAVLFITGIIILTSGKYRQFSQLCRNCNK